MSVRISVDAADRDTITAVNARYQNRYYLKYDFIEAVKTYLQTKPNSDERKAFVKERHRLLEEIAKVSRFNIAIITVSRSDISLSSEYARSCRVASETVV